MKRLPKIKKALIRIKFISEASRRSFAAQGSSEDLVNDVLASSCCFFDNIVPFTLDHQESWHRLNTVFLSDLRSLIYIDFDVSDSSFFALSLDIRGDSDTGSAPCGMTVNNCDSSVFAEELLDLSRCSCVNVSHDNIRKYLLYK